MNDLFLAIFLVSIICLVLGLIKPKIFSKIFKQKTSRKTVGFTFFSVIIVSFVLFVATTPNTPQKSTSETVTTNAASTSTTPAATNKATATSSAPTVVSPEPINLSGTGQEATDKFTLSKGLAVFEMTHKGSGSFAPKLLDSDGNDVELLANEIGAFNGSKATQIPSDGQYLINMTASAGWTVTILQPRQTSADATRSFSGNSQAATDLFSLPSGLVTFQMHHSGEGNWAPVLLDAKGNMIELLANEIGNFDGSKAIHVDHSGLYVLDVTANGPWTITIK